MKILRIIALGLMSAVLGFAADTPKSATKKEKDPPEWDALFGKAPLPLVWQSAMAASGKIAGALADKKLDEIPDWAEIIHLASNALLAQVKVSDPDKQANITDSLGLLARSADQVKAGASANDVAHTNTAFQFIQTSLRLAQRSLPKEIVDAPPQAVGFAKKEQRDAGKK